MIPIQSSDSREYWHIGSLNLRNRIVMPPMATGKATLIDGAGVTARLLMEKGFRVIDVEDL